MKSWSLLLLLLLVSAATASLFGRILRVSAEPDLEASYEYYGYVPARIWGLESLPSSEWFQYRINPNSILDRALLVFIGNYDQTKVSVYVLPNRSLVESFTVNRLEKATVQLPNGTSFKAVSDKPVTLILMAGKSMEVGDNWVSTFFTGVEGGYVGKEFIFMAVQAARMPYVSGFPLRVFALEDSQITVVDADGSTVADFSLKANQYRQLSFTPLALYRLSSTGNVMLQSWGGGSLFYPAVRGGFAGKLFYGTAMVEELWGVTVRNSPTSPAFVMTGVEDAKARIIDIEFAKELNTTEVVARVNNSMKIAASHILVDSDKPITLMFRSASGGLTYAGVKPGETTEIYVPTGKDALSIGEAYIFAAEGTTVTLDDVRIRVSSDEVIPLQPGMHRIAADRNAVIEVVHWSAFRTAKVEAPDNGLSDFASCVPSLQAMSITSEGIQLKPVLGAEATWIYAFAAVVAVALIAVWQLRKGGKARR